MLMFSYTQVISFQLGENFILCSLLLRMEKPFNIRLTDTSLGNIQEVGGTLKPNCCLGHHFPLHSTELTKASKGKKYCQAPQTYKPTLNTEKVKLKGGRTQTGHLPTCRRAEAVSAPPAPAPTGRILVHRSSCRIFSNPSAFINNIWRQRNVFVQCFSSTQFLNVCEDKYTC